MINDDYETHQKNFTEKILPQYFEGAFTADEVFNWVADRVVVMTQKALAATNQQSLSNSQQPSNTVESKKYIISTDVYVFGEEMGIHSFTGSWRELLYHLLDIDESNINDEASHADHTDCTIKDLTDAELESWFDFANGDGQPYTQVFCVEDDKKVLG